MQSVFSLVHRAALVVAGALALGACSRAEYAMLPKSPAYLGTKNVAVAPRPAAQPAPATVAAATEPAAPVAAPAPAAVANVVPRRAPVAKTTPTVAAAPVVATPVAPAPVVAAPAAATTSEAAPAAPKLNLVQRLALKKISKKLEKLAANSPQLKQRDAAASTSRINGNLRTGIILLIIGLLVGLLNGLIGTIIAIIGLIFVVLWLLDEL